MITLEGLSKRYGDTTAVDDLDLTVSPGRITGLLGLDNPTAGTALVQYGVQTVPGAAAR
jgi:ABC-2 type transport system ATP-binding protein